MLFIPSIAGVTLEAISPQCWAMLGRFLAHSLDLCSASHGYTEAITDKKQSKMTKEQNTAPECKRLQGYVSVNEASEYLGLSKVHIYRLTSQKRIPHYKIGGNVRFKLSELDEFVKPCRVATEAELAKQAKARATSMA